MKFQSTLWVGMILACACAACGITAFEKRKAAEEAGTQVDVQLLAFDINIDTQSAARRIQTATDDREIRREMVVWQIHTAEELRRALQHPDPRWAFVDLWAMLLQSRAYVTRGPGKGKLGEQAGIAIEALDGMIVKLERCAEDFIPAERLEAVKAATRTWADDHPMEGEDMTDADSIEPGDEGGGLLGAVEAVPEGIFSFGGGVKDTAVSVSKVAAAADRGVEVMSSLPLMTRWQTELLLYSIEENESVRTLLEDVSRVSESVATAAETAEGLPERVEQAAVKAIREVESTQPQFQRTLDKGRGIVDQAHATVTEIAPLLDKVQENGEWVERTSEHATRAGEAWERAFGQLNLLVNPPGDLAAPPPEPSPPFDMKDVAKTAERATRTAEEVHATVVELRGIIEGQGIDERLAQVNAVTRSALADTNAMAGDLVDRIATRAALLIVLFFGMLLGYRFVALRLARAG